jgi:hypothetical protein
MVAFDATFTLIAVVAAFFCLGRSPRLATWAPRDERHPDDIRLCEALADAACK